MSVFEDALVLVDKLKTEKRLSKRGMILTTKLETNVKRAQRESSINLDMVQRMVDREFLPPKDTICLKARGGVSIKVDREKACGSSKFIQAAISSEMGNVSMSELEMHGKSEINLEHDDPELIKIVALMMTLGDSGIRSLTLPHLTFPRVYELMELSTRLGMPDLCAFASSLLDERSSFSDASGLRCLVDSCDQIATCEADIRPHWDKVYNIALRNAASIIAAGPPRGFSRDIPIRLLDEIVAAARGEGTPELTEVEMPAAGGTASSQNGFQVTVQRTDDAVSVTVKVSPESRMGIRLAGDDAGVCGLFTHTLSVTPTEGAPDPSDGSGDDSDEPVAAVRRKAPAVVSHSDQPHPNVARAHSYRQRLAPGAAPARLKVAFCGRMDRLHVQCLVLLRYCEDACRPDSDGAGLPVLDALRHLRGILEECERRAEAEGGGRAARGAREEAWCARRLWELLCGYAARGFLRVRGRRDFLALPGDVLEEILGRDELWTDGSEGRVLRAVVDWGRLQHDKVEAEARRTAAAAAGESSEDTSEEGQRAAAAAATANSGAEAGTEGAEGASAAAAAAAAPAVPSEGGGARAPEAAASVGRTGAAAGARASRTEMTSKETLAEWKRQVAKHRAAVMRIAAGNPRLRLKFEFSCLLQRVRFPFIEAGEVPRILGARGLRFAQKWGDVDRLRSEAFDAQVAAAAAVAGGGGGELGLG